MEKCEKCKKLKEEIKMLNNLVSIAQPSEWDLDGVYEDLVSGRDEYTGEYSKPDKKFAKWFAKRFGIEEETTTKVE